MTSNLKITEDEYGFTHKFIFPSGTDLTWVTGYRLIIEKNGVDQLNITTNLSTILPNIIVWEVQNGQTNFNGKCDGTLIISSGSRREELHFNVEVLVTKE